MSRSVRIVVLCEDRQHESFVRRFLREIGWNTRSLRIARSPSGRGSAEQYVHERFPAELQAVRSKGGERAYLIVIVDGDNQGVSGRRASLEEACVRQQKHPPQDSDHVLVCVPTWTIETWFSYLGGETVDETQPDYPRLSHERDCDPFAKELATMCRHQELRSPSPTSLQDACNNYQRVFG